MEIDSRQDQHSQQDPTQQYPAPEQPAEAAPAFAFLASQESSYITAERIGVTGGMPPP